MKSILTAQATSPITTYRKPRSKHSGAGSKFGATAGKETAGAHRNRPRENPRQPLLSAKSAPRGLESSPRPLGGPQAKPRQSGAAGGAGGRCVEPNVNWHEPVARLRWFTDSYPGLVDSAAARGVQPPEAAVHDAWFRAEKDYHAKEGPYPPFFRLVLRCVAADYFRELRRTAQCEPLAEDHVVSVPEEVEEVDRVGEGDVATRACLLRRALRLLPRRDLRLLMAAYGRRTPLKQLAKKSGLKKGALAMRLQRAARRASAIFGAAGAYRTATVAALVETSQIQRLCLALPRPACRKPRPSCQRATHASV